MTFRARAVVINDGRLAVIKRVKDGRRYAVLPGGKVEVDETPQQAAVRELAEETGLHTRVERLLWHDEDRGQMIFSMVPVSGELILGDPERGKAGPANVYEPAWVTGRELGELNLQPSELHGLLRPLLAPDPIDVVGLPAAGWSALGEAERTVISRAEVIFGDGRQLGLVPEEPGQERVHWPRRLRDQLLELLDDHAGRRIAVLASGDPLVAGIGTTLIELLGAGAVRIHPGVSSVALARARLGWPAETCEVVRIASRGATELVPRLSPGRRLLVLSRDADTPAAVGRLLVDQDFGASRLTILGDLGTAVESRLDAVAHQEIGPAPRLHLIGVECAPDRARPTWSTAPGLPDDAYDHDGQLTKRLVRAAALAHLRPAPGELLWDLGAGAGSVAIEWCRAAPGARAVAVERDPVRGDRVIANAGRLGADVELVLAPVLAALPGLPPPDAVFIGGGGDAEVITTALAALRPGGRLVAHAVTTETEVVLHRAHHDHGGELVRIGLEHLTRLGSFHGWDPARAIVQWSVQVPWRPRAPA